MSAEKRDKCNRGNRFWADLEPCVREKGHDGAHVSFGAVGESWAWGDYSALWDVLQNAWKYTDAYRGKA